MDRIEKLYGQMENLDPFSEEYDAFTSTILGGSQQLAFDGEGRVMLPKSMMDAAGISDQAVFVGKGQTFEIWEPKAFEAHMTAARKLAQEKRSQLRAVKKSGDEV